MGDYKTILDVSKSFRSMLVKNYPGLTEQQVTFSPPDKAATNHKLSIFLYRVIENVYTGRDEYEPANVISKDGKNEVNFNLRHVPIYLSLFYLITPINPEEEEHIDKDQLLLGKIIQVFNENRTIKDEYLHDSMKGENLKLYLHSLSIDDMNKLWGVLSMTKDYKLSLYCEISPVRIDSALEKEETRVVTREIKEKEFTSESEEE